MPKRPKDAAPTEAATPATLLRGAKTKAPARVSAPLALMHDAPATSPDAPFLSDLDYYLLAEGTHWRSFEKLGAHAFTQRGKAGMHFAVWAPNASSVSVVGDFNDWDAERHKLCPSDSGVWSAFVPGVMEEAAYKFALRDAHGHPQPWKADPYGFAAELPPATASKVHALPEAKPGFPGAQGLSDPISIYEVHLGSWRRGEDNRYLTYDELADSLIPYVKKMGFTHIELMPVSEHPFGGSWGYQPIGLFAPTRRFGSPEAFERFVNAAHDAGLHVILDWVPGHFPNDAHGLARFDGTALYEHADPREGMHQDWNTLIYNYGRTEVANFLIANALFWIERYGIDALRVDAVASMIYRNYSRKPGEWVPNREGGVENFEATAFLKRLNEQLFARFPHATSFAEESTAWPGVSRPTYNEGLGFGFKWNMGWMHDTLTYMATDPLYRRYHHELMTFGMIYAYTENFVLPLSHDESVHGKGSLLARMPGDEWQRFANLRAYYGFMFGHPGKKLLFMGSEFGQTREWNHEASLDWHETENPLHEGVRSLVRDLNHLYRSTPALHEHDADPKGFEWLKSDDASHSVYAFARRGRRDDALAIVVSNFTPVPREGYRIGVPLAGFYKECLNSDAAEYQGSGMGNWGGVASEAIPHDGRPHSLLLTLPPLSTLIFAYEAAS